MIDSLVYYRQQSEKRLLNWNYQKIELIIINIKKLTFELFQKLIGNNFLYIFWNKKKTSTGTCITEGTSTMFNVVLTYF